jgi:hypothetical protein
MSFFDIIIDPIQALLPRGIGNILDPLSLHNVLGFILPKPTGPQAQKGGDQVYNLQSQQNQAQIGNPQTVVMGLARRYFELRAQSWVEYVNNDQVLHQYMRVGVGINELKDLRIGTTDSSAFPGFVFELLLPGQPMTLFHPNVYTNTDLSSVEIATGALLKGSLTGTYIFAPLGALNRINHEGGGAFGGGTLNIGSTIGVSGAGAGYDGAYPLASYDSGAEVVDLTGVSFTPAAIDNVTCTWDAYNTNQNNLKQAEDVALVFDAGLSTIKAVPTEDNPNRLDIFAVGDLIAPIDDAAGANKLVSFEVLALEGDGSLVVDPPPTAGSCISTVVLLRRYHGPYDACPQGEQVDKVAVDIEFPQGLVYNGTDGNAYPAQVSFDIQWRKVDDLGIPQSDWTSFDLLTIKAAKRTPQRLSFVYDLPEACRAQVRLTRAWGDTNDSLRQDASNWTGLKGYIVPKEGEQPAIDENSTCLAVTLRASGTISNGSDKKINGLVQAWKQIWDGAAWQAEAPTRNPVWGMLDAMRGPYTAGGVPIPDSMLDLAGFVQLAAAFDDADIEFNGAFETETTLLDACNSILRVGQAALTFDWPNGKYTYRHDVPQSPVQLFTDKNSDASGLKLTLLNENAPTGVQVKYQDPIAWEERDVGIGDTDSAPQRTDLRNGITSRQQAWAEANYEWNELRFRNRQFQVDAELEPIMLKFGNAVLVQSAAMSWGQGAEVVSASEDGLTLVVDPALNWSAVVQLELACNAAGDTLACNADGDGLVAFYGEDADQADTGVQHFVYLRDPGGRPGAKINCSRGASDAELILASPADVEITGDENGEERTEVAFGAPGNEPMQALVLGVQWSRGNNGGHQAQLQCVLDDAEMYADPGDAPPDPYAVSGTAPDLAITGLDATADDLSVTATWDANANVRLYEIQWQHAGDIGWQTPARGKRTYATFSIDNTGVINIRVRGYGEGGGLLGDWALIQRTIGNFDSSLVATCSPTSLEKDGTRQVMQSGYTSVTVRGGTPPYSIFWTRVSGSSGITAKAPTSNTTNFAGELPFGGTIAAIFRPRVTDSVGAQTLGTAVTVTFNSTYTGGTPQL